MSITKGSVVAFLDAFLPKLEAAGPQPTPLRFIALTGMIVVRDQNASVWLRSRHAQGVCKYGLWHGSSLGIERTLPRGRLANEFANYADGHPYLLQIYFSNIGLVYGQNAY